MYFVYIYIHRKEKDYKEIYTARKIQQIIFSENVCVLRSHTIFTFFFMLLYIFQISFNRNITFIFRE